MSNPFATGGGNPEPVEPTGPTSPAEPTSSRGTGNPFGAPSPPPQSASRSQGWGTSDAASLPGIPQPAPAAPTGGALVATSGPWIFLIAALVTAVLGTGLGGIAWLTSTATESGWLALAVSGWALAGIITFILLGLHVSADTKRQTASLYISNSTQTLLYRVALGLGVIGVLITAVEIALWFGKAFGG